ncbi:MAG: CoA transferase [Deltaproteobacteria bacterium]|nr:MAG: CoA transferase [Deltaproteobacteria bacterium]
MEAYKPLEGIKVLDFSWILTGPLVARYLADWGATVVKIESKFRPDEVRNTAPFKDDMPGLDRSAAFANWNSGKYSIAINMKHPQGIALAKKLVAWTDIVIESFRPGVLKRLGLDYEEMRAIKEDIIVVSHTTQGQTGPYALQPLIAHFVHALAGITDLTGWPDRTAAGLRIAYGDNVQVCLSFILIMAALDYRKRTGKGNHIDISQLECLTQVLAPTFLDYSANGRIQSREGNHSTFTAPHGIYRCKGEDKWCAIAVFNDKEWEALCYVMDKPELISEPKFATGLARKQHEDELDRLINEWTTNFTAEEVMSKMQRQGISAGVVQNGQDIVDSDPQLAHRHHLFTLDHREIGRYVSEAPGFRLSEVPLDIQQPSPCIGEHNYYVCSELLGISDEDFADMVSAGVLE